MTDPWKPATSYREVDRVRVTLDESWWKEFLRRVGLRKRPRPTAEYLVVGSSEPEQKS